MSVKIGHAVGDENGAARGGRPGDQTGREIRVQNWYNRDGGWGVYLECKNTAMADRAAAYMQQICEDDSFGYDQDDRKTGYEAIVSSGSIAGAADSEFDCSSLVYACYILSGLNVSLGSTHSMEKVLLNTGLFTAYKDAAHLSSGDYAKRGGIYLKAGKHVVMVLNDGPKAGMDAAPASSTKTNASGKEIPRIRQAAGVETPYVLALKNVRVRTGPGTKCSSLGYIAKGTMVTYGDTDPDTGWHAVETAVGPGFVSGSTTYTKLVT